MTTSSWSRINTALLLVVLLAVIGLFASRAQGGPLDPPDAPTSTDGVRLPGTPISSLPFVISQPGHYYVTRNLSMAGSGDGITIQTDNVVVDLMGFELSPGVSLNAAFSQGVSSPARRNWTIRNGTLRDWPYNAAYVPLVTGTVFEDLEIIASSGITTAPVIYSGNDAVVRRVRLHMNPANVAMTLGENARVSDCLIDTTGTSITAAAILGPNSSIASCTVIGYKTGLSVGANSAVHDCVMKRQTETAIFVGAGSLVVGCIVELDPFTIGIWSGGSSTISRNTIHCTGSPANTGVLAGGGDWVDENHLNQCSTGIDAQGSANAITRNRCRGTATGDCVMADDPDDVGAEGTASTATRPWANIVD